MMVASDAHEEAQMTTAIRHAGEQDLAAIHQIMQAEHVVMGTMRLPYADESYSRDRLKPVNGTFKLVALVDNAVAGYCELITHPDQPRHRHAGEINMVAVHPDYRGRNLGRAMMQEMIRLADNWLQLTRLGLIVWKTNPKAIALYESLGFRLEGTMPRFAFCNGSYIDACVMGRLLLDQDTNR